MNPISKFTPKIRREKTTISNPEKKEDAVQVFCRLRPLQDDEESTCIKLLSPTMLVLTTPPGSKGVHKEVRCKFRHIFTGYATQNEVFEHVAYPLLEDLLKGKNGLLFTYGITGSGKTYTLTGDQANPGIMPKCIHTIFNTISDYQAPKSVIKSDKMNGFEISQGEIRPDTGSLKTPFKKTKKANKSYINDGIKIIDINEDNLYAVFVSYIEIYNNTVYDLLDENGNGKSLQAKIIREDAQKNMYVNGVVETEVKSAEEAFELFNIGQKKKRMGNTVLNSVSSRSHSIFNIRIVQCQQTVHNEEGQSMIPDSNLLKIAQLSLVDLAGSERTSRTQNTGQLLKEASQINNSLTTLRTCLEVLRKNQMTGATDLIPYRRSRLTLLFKNYFEGEGNVSLIVCVNPSIEDFEENLQVMNFAETTQDVKITRVEPKFISCKKTIQKKSATTPHIKNQWESTILPKLPEIKLDFNNYEESQIALQKLVNFLRTRTQKMESLESEFEQRVSDFRKRLIHVDKENVLGKSEVKNMKAQLQRQKQRNANVEAKLADMEVRSRDLSGKNKELQNNIQSLRNVIAEKDMKINKHILEKEKIKQRLVLQSEEMTHELDAKLRRQREHLQATMEAKNNKLKKMRELLEREITPPDIEEREQFVPVYDIDKKEVPASTPVATTPMKKNETVTSTATSAPRRHRSRSAGEVWLEHNSIRPVPLGTVLQPSIKKRKSVTKLCKASDITNPKQSKYCLVAQEQDTDGEVETKVYKGDILPTCGGGAQVIFNDVEKLRQESPTASK